MRELNDFFKSIIDQDPMPVVISDLEHIIVYMNPAAVENYRKRGGAALVGRSLMNCHNSHSCAIIEKVINWFAESKEHNCIHTFFDDEKNKDVYMVALRDAKQELIGYYEKHELRTKDETPFYDFGDKKPNYSSEPEIPDCGCIYG